MKFSCEKYILQNACLTASRAAAAKSPVPALEGLLIEAMAGKIRITGYNLREGIYTTIDADVEIYGKSVLNTKLFNEMLRRLPDGIIYVEIDDNENCTVRCGKSNFNIMAISPEDFPELPDVEEMSSVTIPQNILKSMINQTSFAIATSDVRPVYTGILFDIEGNCLTLVAVDGYRLAKRTETIESQMSDCSFIVPGYALADIERICTDEDKGVVIALGQKHISFCIGETVVIARRLEGEFLNYKKSIPTVFKYKIKVSKSEILSTIGRVSLVIREKDISPVKLKFNDGVINCSCSTPIGKADDAFICEGNGAGLEVGFNDKYITDALKAAGSDELNICLNSGSSPCIIEASDGSNKFAYMVLPVRLRAGN